MVMHARQQHSSGLFDGYAACVNEMHFVATLLLAHRVLPGLTTLQMLLECLSCRRLPATSAVGSRAEP